jgi:CxxC motif-containing protein
MEKELVCISCPIGCRLTVTVISPDVVRVLGNKCNKGEIYGREEILRPKRTVTACVRIRSNLCAYLPVKTDRPLLKEHIHELLKALYGLEAQAPVRTGDVLITDYNGLGVNVVCAKTVRE